MPFINLPPPETTLLPTVATSPPDPTPYSIPPDAALSRRIADANESIPAAATSPASFARGLIGIVPARGRAHTWRGFGGRAESMLPIVSRTFTTPDGRIAMRWQDANNAPLYLDPATSSYTVTISRSGGPMYAESADWSDVPFVLHGAIMGVDGKPTTTPVVLTSPVPYPSCPDSMDLSGVYAANDYPRASGPGKGQFDGLRDILSGGYVPPVARAVVSVIATHDRSEDYDKILDYLARGWETSRIARYLPRATWGQIEAMREGHRAG